MNVPGTGEIRVLLVDDQRLMRDGLRTLLSLEADLTVVDALADGVQVLPWLADHEVDVILMDIRMPEVNGIDATRAVMTKHPKMKVLILTTFDEQDEVVAALEVGAVGYLLKDMPAEEIAQAIRTAMAGGAVLPPSVAQKFLSAMRGSRRAGEGVAGSAGAADLGHGATVTDAPTSHVSSRSGLSAGEATREPLTEREQDVLSCLAEGLSNREIAQRLFVTEGTVKNHVSSLIAKLDLRDRTQVALYAVRNGFGDKG